MNENDEQCEELNEIIYQISGDFWKQAYSHLCELQNEYKADNDSSKSVSLLLRKGLKDIAKQNGLKYSSFKHNEHYYISIIPFPIYVGIEMETNDFTVSAPHINARSFTASEWGRGLKWVQDYINIDVKPLEEKTQNIWDKFYLNLKTAEIVKASIQAVCKSMLDGKCLEYKLNQSRLKSEIKVRMGNGEADDDKAETYNIRVYHKPFSEDASLLLKLLQSIHEMEIEDKICCWKEPE